MGPGQRRKKEEEREKSSMGLNNLSPTRRRGRVITGLDYQKGQAESYKILKGLIVKELWKNEPSRSRRVLMVEITDDNQQAVFLGVPLYPRALVVGTCHLNFVGFIQPFSSEWKKFFFHLAVERIQSVSLCQEKSVTLPGRPISSLHTGVPATSQPASSGYGLAIQTHKRANHNARRSSRSATVPSEIKIASNKNMLFPFHPLFPATDQLTKIRQQVIVNIQERKD